MVTESQSRFFTAKTTWCLNCERESVLTEAYNDDLGWHTVCPICGSSYDIDIEDHIMRDGERVGYGGKIGVVCGNNAKDALALTGIAYYVCPIEEVRMADATIPGYYVKLNCGELTGIPQSRHGVGS